MSRNKNPYLKSSNKLITYTSTMISEVAKCATDPKYFMENYVYIKTLQGKKKFILRPYQHEMIDAYQHDKYAVVLSARQSGKTIAACIFLLWYAMFHTGKDILIASNNSINAMELIDRIQYSYEELPDWLKVGINNDNWNKHTCGFDNKSRILSTTTSKNAGRGLVIAKLYVDEFAFVLPHIQHEFWSSIQPTLATGGTCIMSSTPNGDIDLFSNIWRGAEAGTNPFTPIRVKWDDVPGRDEKFKEEQISIIGQRRWEQEFECKFLSAEKCLFDGYSISQASESLYDVEFTIDEQDFWKKINNHSTYLIGVDPSEGDGNDYSVIEVYEFPSLEQVMEYRTNTDSSYVMYSYLKKVCRFFEANAHETYMSVERNGVGNGILSLYEADEDPLDKTIFISEQGKTGYGFFSSASSRLKALLTFKELFESGHLKINSKILLTEMQSLVKRGGKFTAATGATDDCIFATLIVIRILLEMADYNISAYDKIFNMEAVDNNKWDIPTIKDKEYDCTYPILLE